MHDAIIQHGTDFDDTKALFNVGFYITEPLANAITNKDFKIADVCRTRNVISWYNFEYISPSVNNLVKWIGIWLTIYTY